MTFKEAVKGKAKRMEIKGVGNRYYNDLWGRNRQNILRQTIKESPLGC